jgi:hypothetical protein
MDLQFLPHIFVKNPHIRRVYDAYLHAFDTLRSMPLVVTPEDNARLTDVLQRLVDEHGVPRSPSLKTIAHAPSVLTTQPINASSASRVSACICASP